MSGYQLETRGLKETLAQIETQVAGYLNAPESEVSDGSKLIALSVQSVGLRLTIAQRETRDSE